MVCFITPFYPFNPAISGGKNVIEFSCQSFRGSIGLYVESTTLTRTWSADQNITAPFGFLRTHSVWRPVSGISVSSPTKKSSASVSHPFEVGQQYWKQTKKNTHLLQIFHHNAHTCTHPMLHAHDIRFCVRYFSFSERNSPETIDRCGP